MYDRFGWSCCFYFQVVYEDYSGYESSQLLRNADTCISVQTDHIPVQTDHKPVQTGPQWTNIYKTFHENGTNSLRSFYVCIIKWTDG
jgi:hypothetical protein